MFESNSRYYNLETATYTTPDGENIAYKRRRFLPRGEDLQLLTLITVTEGDRLDNLTARTLGDPEVSWRIADANNTLNPNDLTAQPGTTIRVPDPDRLIVLLDKAKALMLLGIHLTLLIGPTVAVPAPPPYLEALQGVQVSHSDSGRSGFQLTFAAGRSGAAGLVDYPLLSLPLLKPNNRVIVIVTFSAMPRVLMDGIITHQQLSPGDGTLTVTGEDVSVMMDREEKNVEHPAQDETIIALKIIATYATYGMIPMVIPPLMIDPPIPIERIPVQRATDLAYLKEMAERHGYVFYVAPGPAPFTNMAYWVPPVRVGLPQKALSVNLGPETNVTTINFQNDSNAPTLVAGQVQDRQTGQTMPVQTFASTRLPLAAFPAILVNQPNVRTTRFEGAGLNTMQAFARAQGQTDASTDNVLTVSGDLDAVRYGDLLQARGIVGLRGAGYNHDGFYYVKSVSHSIRRGEYKQHFTIAREGYGSTTPIVRP